MENCIHLHAEMGPLYVVPTPVGNMEDITLRALRTLKEADVVLAEDTRTSGILLKHFDIHAHLCSHHKFNEHQTAEAFARRIKAGETMALVSDAGTPAISDPGFMLVRACAELGVRVECLPGATAFVPALVMSALPCERFAFEGFLPQKKGRLSRVQALADEERTMIFYESPHRVVKALQLFGEIFGTERRAAAVREISKLHEECLRGTLAELEQHFTENEPRGEFVLLVEGRKKEKKDRQERQNKQQTHKNQE